LLTLYKVSFWNKLSRTEQNKGKYFVSTSLGRCEWDYSFTRSSLVEIKDNIFILRFILFFLGQTLFVFFWWIFIDVLSLIQTHFSGIIYKEYFALRQNWHFAKAVKLAILHSLEPTVRSAPIIQFDCQRTAN